MGGQFVYRYEMSPDGRYVVYLATEVDGLKLYSADLRDAQRSRRLDSRPCGAFVISPDSRRVVYRDWFSGSLSTVPIDGSEAPILIAPSASTFEVTSDGRTVVFLGLGTADRGVHRVPIDGSAEPKPVHLSADIDPFFRLTADSQRVVYVVGHTGSNSPGLIYSARLDGSAPVALNTSESRATIREFVLDPTSRWIVYREGNFSSFSRGLYTVPLDGSAAPVLLNSPRPGLSLFFFLWTPRFTSDGGRVVFVLDNNAHGGDVYSGPVDGSSAAIRISPPMPSGVVANTFRITLDESRVVYTAGPFPAYELFVVPILGGAEPTRLNTPLPPGGRVSAFELSPDEEHLAYVADQEIAGRNDVYLAALDASAPPIRVSDPVVSPFPIGSPISRSMEFVPDGSLLVYTGYDAGAQLFAVDLLGIRRPWRLDGPQVPGGSVRLSEPYPSWTGEDYYTRLGMRGRVAVYLADQDQDEVVELFTSPLFTRRVSSR